MRNKQRWLGTAALALFFAAFIFFLWGVLMFDESVVKQLHF